MGSDYCKDCREHSGVEQQIENLEGQVITLSSKYDWVQKTFIGGLVALSLNLIGVILIIIRMYYGTPAK